MSLVGVGIVGGSVDCFEMACDLIEAESEGGMLS